MCRVVALTRDIVVLMEVKIRRRADAVRGGLYGVVVSIEVKIQTRDDALRVDAYEWRHGIDGGKDTKTRRCYACRHVWHLRK